MKKPNPPSLTAKRLLASLLAGVFLLAVLLHLPPAKRLLRPVVAATLSWAVGGPVELGALDYALWRGELTLHGLHIVPDRARLPFELAARRTEIRVSLLGRVRVRSDSPELTLFVPQPGAETSDRSLIARLNPLTLHMVELANGSVRVMGSAEQPWLEVRSVGLDLERLPDGYRAQIDAAGGLVVSDSTEIPFGPVASVVETRDGELRLVSSRIEKEDSHAELNGTATSLDPLLGHFDADFRADASILRELLPEVDLRGVVEGSARLDIDSDGPRVSVDVRSEGLAWNGLEPWGMTGEAIWTNGSLQVDNVNLTGYGGAVRATGRIDLPGDRQSIRVDFDGIDLGRTASDLAGRGVPLAARAMGRVELSMTGWDLQVAEGEGRITLEPLDDGRAIPSLSTRGELLLTLQEGAATLESEGISIPGGNIGLTARVEPIAPSGRIDATYRVRIDDLGVVPRLLPSLQASMQAIDLGGDVMVQGRATGPLSDVSWNGTLTSRNLRLLGETHALDAQLGLGRSRLRVDALTLRGASGAAGRGYVVMEGEIPLASGAGPWDLQGEATAVELERLSPFIGAPIEGLAAGRFEIAGDAADPDWSAEMRATELPLPRQGELSAALRKNGRELFVETLRLDSSAGSLEASGRYQLDGSQVAASLQGQGIRLAELRLLTDRLGEMDGVLDSLQLEFQGSMPYPAGQLSLLVREPSLRGVSLPNLTVEMTSNGDNAELEARIEDGRRLLSARGDLQSPYPVQASLDLSTLPLERLVQSDLLLGDPEVLVQAWGELSLEFPLADPSRIRYRAAIEQLVGSYHGIGGGAGAPFSVEGDLESLRVEGLDLIGNRTAIAVAGRIPLHADEAFDLRLRGDARLELLEPAFEDAELAGRASADLFVGGTLDRLELTGDAIIQEGEGAVLGVRFRDVNASLEGETGRVRLRSLTGSVLGGEFRIQGELPLPSSQSTETTRVQFEITEVNVARLLSENEAAASEAVIEVTASGSLETPAASAVAIRGSGTVTRIEAGFGELAMVNAEPAPWSLDRGRFDLPELHLAESGTDVRVGMSATLSEDALSWEASLRGRVDNALVNPLLGAEGIVVSGATTLDVSAQGTTEDFDIGGTGAFQDARIVFREPPLALSNVQGEMRFDGTTVTLSGVTAEAGGGRVEGSGSIDLGGTVDLRVSAESVRLNYPEGLRSEQSGSFQLSGGPETYLLSGDLWLIQSLFDGELTIGTEALDSMPGDLALSTSRDTFSERLRLEIRAQTVDDLRIDNDRAQLQTGGNILVTGTLASPEIDGLVTLTPDGTFQLGRNEYRIESGQMVLRGYPTEPPELDLTMRTTVSDVDIIMEVRGPLDELNTELSAPDRPGLTQSDLASLLVTGRVFREVGELDRIDQQQQQAVTEQLVSFVSGSLAGLAESGIAQVLPFQSITVDPSRIASEVDPNARFTLGVGVTDELSVTYSVSLNNSRSRLWIVDYVLPKNVELRGSQLEDEFTGAVSQRLFFDFHQAAAARRGDGGRRVGLIRLVGAPPGLEEAMEGEIDTGADERYDYWKTVDDVRRLQVTLREAGYLGALVDVETVPVEESNLVDLVYRVDPGRPVEIVWRGDDPGDAIREAVTDAWDGRVPENFLLTELAALVLRELWQQGHYQASVDTSLEDTAEGNRRAVFRISRGPRSAGLDIEFEGNEALSDRELRGALPPESSSELYELVFTSPQRFRETIERFYASRGYLDARAGELVERAGVPGGRFHLILPIEEGGLSRVATLEVEGAVSIPPQTLFDELDQQAGEPFRFSAYRQDRSTLSSIYRRQGFAEVRVRGSLERLDDGLAVVYEIDEGPRALVGSIRIVGNQMTRAGLIRRQLTFREGDPLRLSDLTDSQKRLYDLGIFRSADIRVEPVEPNGIERDVIVEVIETPDLNVSYGLRYNTEERLQVLTQLGAPNVLGGAQHVGLTVRADPDESLVRATFSTPYLFSRFDLDTDVFASRETEDTEFFFDRIWSFTFQQSRSLTDWMNLQWRYSFRRVHTVGKVDLGPIPFDFTVNKNLLGTSLIEDRRDSLIRPTRGRYWSVTLQGAPAQLANDVTFIKTYGQLITFFPLGGDVVWAASYRLGIADALGQFLPPDDRFTAGGIDTVRGFAQDTLGPVDPITDTAIGGEGIAVFNQEVRFPIYRWFHGGVFLDAGNVYLEKSDFDPLDLRYSAGLGIRLALPFGLLRLDWARALDREPGEKSSQFWFSFGHAF